MVKMVKTKKGLGKGFTWKRFATVTIAYFAATILFSILFDDKTLDDIFMGGDMVKRVVMSVMFGFIMAFFFEPKYSEKEES